MDDDVLQAYALSIGMAAVAEDDIDRNDFKFDRTVKPIKIPYDERFYSLCLETLGFDHLSDGNREVPNSGFTSGESDIFQMSSTGYGLPLASWGPFGVPREARPVTFCLLMYLIGFRQLGKDARVDYVTRLNTLVNRYSGPVFQLFGSTANVPPDDAGLTGGQWKRARDLLHDAYGRTYDSAEIAMRQELFKYPWALFDVEFTLVWRALQAGNSMGSFPSEAEWNASVDSTKTAIEALGKDARLLFDTGSAIVNSACPTPAAKGLCAAATKRIVAPAAVMDAAAKPAAELTNAVAGQTKDLYGTFKGWNQGRLLRRYQIDFHRRRYIHFNYAVRGMMIPKVTSILAPAQIASGRANDPLDTDRTQMPADFAIVSSRSNAR